MMPSTPKVAGVMPLMSCRTGAWMPSEPFAPGADGGMKGVQLSRLMKPMPAMMTKSTMKSLTPTSTRLTRIDSLMPLATSSVRRSDEDEGRQVEVPTLGRPERLWPGDAELVRAG